jgi:hypothetical protein
MTALNSKNGCIECIEKGPMESGNGIRGKNSIIWNRGKLFPIPLDLFPLIE